MGYWIIADASGEYVAETDTYQQAVEYIRAASERVLQVIPYFEFYGLA